MQRISATDKVDDMEDKTLKKNTALRLRHKTIAKLLKQLNNILLGNITQNQAMIQSIQTIVVET